jgi:hypothetical protein
MIEDLSQQALGPRTSTLSAKFPPLADPLKILNSARSSLLRVVLLTLNITFICTTVVEKSVPPLQKRLPQFLMHHVF